MKKLTQAQLREFDAICLQIETRKEYAAKHGYWELCHSVGAPALPSISSIKRKAKVSFELIRAGLVIVQGWLTWSNHRWHPCTSDRSSPIPDAEYLPAGANLWLTEAGWVLKKEREAAKTQASTAAQK